MVDPDVHIVLVGPMGAGKTTVGRALAAVLDRAFLDSDEVLERSLGRTGAQLATDHGTARLHQIELATLSEMLAVRPGAVIAAAASVVDGDVGRDLLSRHVVVWLDADDDVLADRREHSMHRRRIDAEEARHLRDLRRPHFAACASGTVDTSGDVAETVGQVLRVVQAFGRPGSPTPV